MSTDNRNRVDAAHTQKCELVGEVLRLFGTVRLQVNGYSMVPSVWPGDTLIVQRRAVQEVAVGNILLYRRKARLFAHRVVSKQDSLGKSRISVRGDAFPGQDEPLFNSEILGTVSRIVRGGKCVRPSSRLKLHQRLIGILTWHSNLFARLAVFVHSVCSAARYRERH
jgi:hypothetical protein